MSISPISLNAGIQTDFSTQVSNTQDTGAPTQSYTPLWMVSDGIGRNSLDMLGIRRPSAIGDVSVLIAEASLTLDQTADEAQKNQKLAGLAGLVAALSAFDLTALDEAVTRKQTVVNDAIASQTDLNSRVAPLQQQRDALDTTIGGDRSTITNLNQQLQALDPKSKTYQSDKDQLTNKIAAAETKLHGDLVSRSSIDMQLAQVKIDSLTQQVANLDAEIAAAPVGSDEAAALQQTRDDLQGQLTSMAGELSKFQALKPPSDDQMDSFSNANWTELQSVSTDLQTRLTGYQTDLSNAFTTLDNATYSALMLAAQVSAGYDTDQVRMSNNRSSHDQNIGRSFDGIKDQLQGFDTQLTKERLDDDDHMRDDLAVNQQRADNLKQGLLANLAGILSALAQVAVSGPASPPAGETVANRLRLNI